MKNWNTLIISIIALIVIVLIFNIKSNNTINSNKLVARNATIDSLKKEITKCDSLIHNFYENLKDTLTGVDNAPVAASHSAIVNYINTRK